MTSPVHTTAPSPVRRPQSRRRMVSTPHDAAERQAERAADVVARGGTVSGWSFAASPAADVAAVQRQPSGAPTTDDEKYKEAATKAGEAALETKEGKAVKEKILADPLVKTVRDAASTPTGIATIVGGLGVGVGALAATGGELPIQPPKIPLDRITPGLSAKVTWKGPVAAPTEAGIVLTFTAPGPKGADQRAADRRRAQWAKEAADLRAFQAGLRVAPGTAGGARQDQVQDDIVKSVARSAQLPGLFIPLDPAKRAEPAPSHEKPADTDAKQEEEKRPADAPVQRAPASTTSHDAPATVSVDDALASSGRPLDASSRRFMEARFGVDFSAVRIHDDGRAADGAAGIAAAAFTVDEHIVFGSGRFDPASPAGRHLLAHELAHVVQQSRAATSGPQPIQRRGIFESIGILLGISEGRWEDRELLDYLRLVTARRQIEGAYDSDNKARAIVARWKASSPEFDLSPAQKVLLISEMLDGPTLIEDETAIVDLLELSDAVDLAPILSGPAVGLARIERDIDDKAQRQRLDSFVNSRFAGGRAAVLAGTFTVVGPATPANAPTFGFSPAGLDYRFDGDRSVQDLIAIVAGYSATDRTAALHHLAGTRRPALQARGEALVEEFERLDRAAVPDAAKLNALKERIKVHRRLQYKTEQVILHFMREQIPATAEDLRNSTSPTDPARAGELREALSPLARRTATGARATFRRTLPGETDDYAQKLRAALPTIVNDAYKDLVEGKGPAEHADPSKVHTLVEFERIGRRAKAETDRVFGNFKRGDELRADRPARRGNVHDQFAETERELRRMRPADRLQMARALCFYFFDTERAIRRLNAAHDASPDFGPGHAPTNDEARDQLTVVDEFVAVAANVTRCNEIDRGWPATADFRRKDVFFQLFKGSDAQKDRLLLWDVFQTFIHEYLHTLVHRDYRDYANRFRGPANNTLLEGVDSLLTEIVWDAVAPKVADPDLRRAVEGPAASEPPIAVPPPVGQRYASFTEALRLADLVGIQNVYAAYFLGLIDRIGGTAPASP